jgi:hypothetical protein
MFQKTFHRAARFTWWICDGTLNRIHRALYVECREKIEREASPTKRGGLYRSSRVRRGQANQGQETASCRYARSVAARDRSFRWRSGSRWRHMLLATLFGQFPFLALGCWRRSLAQKKSRPSHPRRHGRRPARPLTGELLPPGILSARHGAGKRRLALTIGKSVNRPFLIFYWPRRHSA